MSFEGYFQQLCKKGHYTTVDCIGYEDEDDTCKICGEKIVWWNIVDVTNGSFEFIVDVTDESRKQIRIDGYIELKEKSKDVCDKCGTCTNLLYHIPKKGGHRK
jgi:hypothetical protein